MRRTIEKLTENRKKQEEKFLARLELVKSRAAALGSELDSSDVRNLLTGLETLFQKQTDSGRGKKRGIFHTAGPESFQGEINDQIFKILSGFHGFLEKNTREIRSLVSDLTEILQSQAELVDAKDKEWDALGSNHVGMIFKSLEWRVDKLAASYEDAALLIKKFIPLKERIAQLVSLLEEKRMPDVTLAKSLSDPLEDWRYTGFENRYRGSSETVKAQLRDYLDIFSKGKKVIDLGCGRGEFLELLAELGIEAEGWEINEQMIDICREKGLHCVHTDILEGLAGCPDNSLGGIFSSQVIEHLPPAYLKRLIEIAYFKLAPSSAVVLETVNPTSVFSLVQIYFLDISHQRPIHPEALRFLLEGAGFSDIEIRFSAPLSEERLQELPPGGDLSETLNRNIDKLNNLLYSPSNFAAVAVKK